MNKAAAILELQERFRQVSQTLNELQRRHWAAAEAQKLGRGGITIVSVALHMSRNTIRRGIQEMSSAGEGTPQSTTPRIRRPGGGRKSSITRAKDLPNVSAGSVSVDLKPNVPFENLRVEDEQIGPSPPADPGSNPNSTRSPAPGIDSSQSLGSNSDQSSPAT